MAALTITNVLKKYGSKKILDQLSFALQDGEFLVLVGPSGCGKSTLLRAIAGLETISGGDIHIGERDVTNLPPKDRDIAMVFQDYALYPHMSVYENIAFGLKIRKLPEAEIDQRVRAASAKLALDSYLGRKPSDLSGGQRQRVAIGRAIVRKPKVFLFDEPLSNLDAKLRGSMRVTIAKLHKDLKATIVYVTHDQIEAMTLADRIIVLNAGKIQQVGTPLDLYYHPKNVFVGTFIGSPPMNLVEGVLKNNDGQFSLISNGGFELPIPREFSQVISARTKPDQELLLGIRPENLKMIEGAQAAGKPAIGNYTAEVIVTEILGATASVICEIAGHELNVTIPEPHRPKRGEKLQLTYASKHLYLFDKASGDSVVESL